MGVSTSRKAPGKRISRGRIWLRLMKVSFGIDDEIHIPLAVAQVGILQAMPLFPAETQALGQQLDLSPP